MNEHIIKKHELSTYAFISYFGLLISKGIQTDTTVFINAHIIAYNVLGNDNSTKRHLSLFAQGIQELSALGYVKLQSSLHPKYQLATILPQEENNKYYTCIPIDAFRKIANVNKAVCRYYCLLLSLLVGKQDTCVAKWTLESLQEQSGLSKDTVIKYNRLLADLKVIYFYDKYVYDNRGKCQSTIFSQWEHKNEVRKYINHYYPDNVPVSKDTVNQRRSYAMMYRWLCDGKQYDVETLEKVKEYSVNHNRQIQTKIDNPNASDVEREYLRTKLFDLSVFERGDCM